MASLTFTVSNNKKSSSCNGRRRPQNKNRKKIFCKVCFDANKPESLYTSHFLKDRPGPNGKVVCPTLLNTECRYCHDNGHFKSHCPQLAERKRVQNNIAKARVQQNKQAFAAGSWMTVNNMKQLDEAILAAKMQQRHKVSVPVAKSTSNSKFAVLEESDDEDEIMLNVPTVAKAIAPQGDWALKPRIKGLNAAADEENELLRKAEITAKLAELDADLQEAVRIWSGSWADDGDIQDLKSQILDLETELASL